VSWGKGKKKNCEKKAGAEGWGKEAIAGKCLVGQIKKSVQI